MEGYDHDARWDRLLGLLEPLHERAAVTARNLCRSAADGDDLYQEAVLRAFDKLDTLRDETRFRSWFFAVLLSIHRSRCRRSFWKRFLPLDEGEDPADPARGGEDDDLLGARRAARALATLPPEQREAVVLFEIEGFSVQEVAEMQGVTVSAVKSRVSRGRKKLAGWYRRHGFRPRRGAPSPRGEEPASEGPLLAFVPSSVPSQSGGRHG